MTAFGCVPRDRPAAALPSGPPSQGRLVGSQPKVFRLHFLSTSSVSQGADTGSVRSC